MRFQILAYSSTSFSWILYSFPIPVKSRTVYAGNLSWSTTDEQLLAFASAGGGIQSAEIKRHEDTKRSKGWGYLSNLIPLCHENSFYPIESTLSHHQIKSDFHIWISLIHFTESHFAEAAVTELDASELNGRKIHLRIDNEGEADPEGASSIYVGNLPWHVSDDELEGIFIAFRPYYCRVMKNMSGRSRGFAILKFNNLEDSHNAITAMNEFEVGGRALEVTQIYCHWIMTLRIQYYVIDK